MINPFIYQTPDQIKDPQKALDLFVDVFKDFYLIENPGNTFVNGARGSGKSMMFRIMHPDCQKLKQEKNLLSDLNYYSIYIPVKDTSLNIQELNYLEEKKHVVHILNEHFMCIYFAIAIFKSLSEENYEAIDEGFVPGAKHFYKNDFISLLQNTGFEGDIGDFEKCSNAKEVFSLIIDSLESLQESFSDYIQRLILSPSNLNYTGALCLYRNFLLPIIKKVGQFEFMPKNKPLYLLIDDADFLNTAQTQILNSWVSFRSTSIVCFKITTQLNYKTYWTTNSQNKIDSPHDYHEINLSEVYTSNLKASYRKNLKDMVERRLKYIAGVEISAESFFPTNEKQEKEYKEFFEAQKAEFNYDYAYRNARLDYRLQLANEYSYSYAGFDQLVHLSSGILRNFIDLASKMFDKASRENPGTEILSIRVGIQDREIEDYSDWVLEQLDKTIDDNTGLSPLQISKYEQLRTLIESMGNAFRKFMVSNSSERRKFSFYYDGKVDKETKEVLKLGVSEGLFHYSKQGSKTGLGRSHQYVLNRILSPVYKLDPFSFTGYLYITPEKLELAAKDTKRFIAYIDNRIKKGDDDSEKNQLKMDI